MTAIWTISKVITTFFIFTPEHPASQGTKLRLLNNPHLAGPPFDYFGFPKQPVICITPDGSQSSQGFYQVYGITPESWGVISTPQGTKSYQITHPIERIM